MTLAFENLPPQKQQLILDAALSEFATHSYAAASTNRIVEKADISKGLLFHYFKNKLGLYLYLLRQCMKLLSQLVASELHTMDRDVFSRIAHISLMKMKQMKEYPLQYEFMLKASREQAPEVVQGYEKIVLEFKEPGLALLYQDLDLSPFKPGIDISKALEIITWTLEGFGNQYIAKHTDAQGNLHLDWEQVTSEIERYCDLLRQGLYLDPSTK